MSQMLRQIARRTTLLRLIDEPIGLDEIEREGERELRDRFPENGVRLGRYATGTTGQCQDLYLTRSGRYLLFDVRIQGLPSKATQIVRQLAHELSLDAVNDRMGSVEVLLKLRSVVRGKLMRAEEKVKALRKQQTQLCDLIQQEEPLAAYR